MDNTISIEQISHVIRNFTPCIKESLMIRWNEWDITIDEQVKFEVIGGILSRQASLVIQFLESISIWNGNIGTIILRSLAENYITIAWILKEDTIKRCEMFVEHGIGQEMLYLEKLKANISNKEPNPLQKKQIEFIEEFIKHERNLHMLDVNIGAWANISIRTMAEDTGCKDFYDFSFTPFTFSAHSTWNHILKYNLKESDNPLHNFMKVPTYHNLPPDIHWADVAIKYLNMCYELADKNFKIKSKIKALDVIFHERLEQTVVSNDEKV